MLGVSVRGTDKAARKFESRMPTSWGLGGEVLAVGQKGKEVEVRGRWAGEGWGVARGRQGMTDERAPSSVADDSPFC